MRGPLYSVSYDGASVRLYVDINDPKWGVGVQSGGRERGFQSFAFHPQFGEAGAPGFGKFYTYTDTTNQTPPADFTTANPATTHDTVLLEWTAKTPGAATYDGGLPRELLRLRQPFANHNAGQLAFHPLAKPGSPEFGLLYMGVADGGSGGDPMRLAQNVASAFGKIFRIDPLGSNSRNKKYGIPPGNPLADRQGRAAGDLRAGRAQPAAFCVGLAQRQHVRRRHRPEHRRGDQPRHGGRQPGMERLGGQLPFHQPPGGEPREAPQRSGRDVSRGRVGPGRSAAAEQLGGERLDRVPRQGDPTAVGPPRLHRHAEWRDVLRQRRQAAGGRPGRHPAHRDRHRRAISRRCSR